VPAKNVTLAGPAVAERCQMPGGDVADMNQIQPRVDKGGDPARGSLQNESAGRGWPHIARPNRRGGIDDYRWEALVRNHR